VNPQNFFAELKRRNVYKIAIAYAVIAWLLIQIATQTFPFFEIPNWMVRAVIVLVLLGFPIALVIAWAFELTPEGLKRTESADELPKKSTRSHAWIYVVVIAGAISVSLFFFGRYTATSKQSGLTEVPAKSIAVLPFENLSGNPENAYFTDGIQEEILMRLAKIADLKVVSRTSTVRYKRSPGSLGEIATQLGVANVLKGRFFWNKRTANDLKTAISYFRQAIEKDPSYALAYAGLADSYAILSAFGAGSPEESLPAAEAAAKKALELDDTLAEAHTSLTLVLLAYDLDFDGSIREFRRAIDLNPNYATAHHWFGIGPLMRSGRFDDAIAECKRAVELDPLSLINNADLGHTYRSARRYDEAIEQLRKTLEMDPGFYYAHSALGRAIESKGDLDAAIQEYQKARTLNDDPGLLALLGHAYASSGNKTEALKILDQLKELSKQRYVSAYSFALVYLGLGDKEEALRSLEKSYQDREGSDIALIRINPFFDTLRGDPRFEELVTKVFAREHGPSP
jgi:tetratricopeptide (TPR) repeat protein